MIKPAVGVVHGLSSVTRLKRAIVGVCLFSVLLLAAGTYTPSVEAAVYDEDHRQTQEDYAKSHSLDVQMLKDSIAATGIVICAGSRSTAQLTLSPDVITTAAHAFQDTSTCKMRSKVTACRFKYTWRSIEHSVPLAASYFKSGLTCPKDSNKANDWAVAKLARPVVGPTPYQIDESKTLLAKAGDRLLAVQSLSSDYCTKSEKTGQCIPDRKFGQGFVFPKTVQDCALRSVEQQEGKLFLTDCAESNGASGSGVFTQDGRTLIGILYSDSMSKIEAQREMSTGHPIVKPYDRQEWSPAEVPVWGAFADAIYEAAGKPRSAGGTLDIKVSR